MGSLILDKKFGSEIGHIRKRTGLKNKSDLEFLKICLDQLFTQGRFAEIASYRDGKISSGHVVRLAGLKEQNEDHALLVKPLWSSLTEWMDSHYSNSRTRSNRLGVLSVAKKKVDFPEALVGDLPPILTKYKQIERNARQSSQFGIFRAFVLRFLKESTLQEADSPLHKQCRRIPNFTAKDRLEFDRHNRHNPSARRKSSHNPFASPAALQKLLFPQHKSHKPIDEDIKEWIWWMALSGAHRSEIEGGISQDDYPVPHITIKGTKTESRDRIVPRILDIPAMPLPSKKRMYVALSRLDNRSEYDLRRTYAVFCLRAQIPALHTQSWLGHTNAGHGSQTSVYQREETLSWIAEDADLLKKYVQKSLANPDANIPDPILPVASYRDLGGESQFLTISDIEDSLNNILTVWFEKGYLRRFFMIKPNSLEDVRHEQKRIQALEARIEAQEASD
jgi:hypothetical protein